MPFVNKIDYLRETKNQIKSAIQNKGILVSDNDTFRSYANKINQIQAGDTSITSDEWQPEIDWRDIEDILDADKEEYEQKVILLLTDELDDSVKCSIKGFQKYKLSDGQIIESNPSTLTTIEFDTSKDKKCSKGYKTRYIVCYNNSTSALNISLPENTIYMIIKKIIISTTTSFQGKRFLECIKINLLILQSSANSLFLNNTNLKKIEGFPENVIFPNNTKTFQSLFQECTNLKKIPKMNFENITNISSIFTYNPASDFDMTGFNNNSISNISNAFYMMNNIKEIMIDFSEGTLITATQAFYGCRSLKKIGKLNLENVTVQTNGNNIFGFCPSLIDIEEITNISISLNFSSSTLLSHSTILKILNGLVDLTGQNENTLTLGTANLNKLSDEEKAIATNKNWILK